MVRTIKTLSITNAELYVITSGMRKLLARFTGEVEIREEQSMVSVLGHRSKGEKRICASFVLCDDMDYQLEDEFSTAKVYEAIGDVMGSERTENLIFSGLQYEDNDPISENVMFRIADLELIKKMLKM